MQLVTLLMTKREIRSKECVSHVLNGYVWIEEKRRVE